jgi:hypothetical protein
MYKILLHAAKVLSTWKIVYAVFYHPGLVGAAGCSSHVKILLKRWIVNEDYVLDTDYHVVLENKHAIWQL